MRTVGAPWALRSPLCGIGLPPFSRCWLSAELSEPQCFHLLNGIRMLTSTQPAPIGGGAPSDELLFSTLISKILAQALGIRVTWDPAEIGLGPEGRDGASGSPLPQLLCSGRALGSQVIFRLVSTDCMPALRVPCTILIPQPSGQQHS